jgi:outer membrane protein assembly factor BamB
MKRAIVRNIAIISAVFIVTLSMMLIVNYFQIRGGTPLRTEVVETLKQLNDANADNPVLQEQIRQLDLLSRKAYFVQIDHLVSGIYILLGMLVTFIVCVRLYYAGYKNIPEKEIDPIDEWAVKSQARKYIVRGVSGLTVAALVFAVLSSPHLRTVITKPEAGTEAVAETETASEPELPEAVNILPAGDTANTEILAGTAVEADTPAAETAETVATAEPVAEEAAAEPAALRVTHNAFRGNNSNGISPAKNLPVKWDLNGGTNIAWKHDIPRHGYNSPVISDNKVFFTGADDQVRELYCHDLNTGERLWTLAAADIPGSPAQMPKTTEDTGLAASTVVTSGKQVCAIFATGDMICADMNGKRLWAKNLGVPDNHYGYASSLNIFGNMVIVQYDNQNSPRVMALDIVTGAERWSKTRSEKVTWSSPVIASVNNTPQLVLTGTPAIVAYNPGSGDQLWRVECLTGEVGASACSANGIVYGASEYSKLVAINAADGNLIWESSEFLPEVSSPVATKDNLYLATSYGMFVAYDTGTGDLRKEHDLGVEFYSSPMIAEGRIYLFSNDGKMHIFSADNDCNLIDSFETGEKTFATPAFTDGKIVVRTEKSIYCVANK